MTPPTSDVVKLSIKYPVWEYYDTVNVKGKAKDSIRHTAALLENIPVSFRLPHLSYYCQCTHLPAISATENTNH
jgi:hypothetical protein